MKTKIINKQNLILLLCVFAIALINQPLLEEGLQRTVRGLFVSFAYIAIVIYWSISVLDSIKEKYSRRIMYVIVSMILFWLLIRACKYEIWDDGLDIAMWYLFYVPQTILPLLVFNMTLHIEGRKPRIIERWLYIPAGIIIAGILTNNMHQLAFRFTDSISSKSGAYSYGILYYISLVWMIAFMIAAIINATRKSRILYKKRVFIILLIWMLVPILYLLYYQFGPFFLRTYFFNFPEGCCLLHIIFLEICIQSGMILSNRQHDEIFDNSSIIAEITDINGTVIHQSKINADISYEDREKAKLNSIIVKDAYELRANKLKGGYIYWLSDVSELININENLKELGAELAEENNILKAEIEAKEKKTALEEQNRIYDSVNEALEEKRMLLLKLLSDKSQIYRAIVISAYMKRKGNLVILSKQGEKSDIRELGLCINESFSYLSLKGCICNCTVSGEAKVNTKVLSALYDIFEEILEQAFDHLEAFLCYIKVDDEGILMRCQIECQSDFVKNVKIVSTEAIRVTLERQDTTLYLNCKAKEVAYE